MPSVSPSDSLEPASGRLLAYMKISRINNDPNIWTVINSSGMRLTIKLMGKVGGVHSNFLSGMDTII